MKKLLLSCLLASIYLSLSFSVRAQACELTATYTFTGFPVADVGTNSALVASGFESAVQINHGISTSATFSNLIQQGGNANAGTFDIIYSLASASDTIAFPGFYSLNFRNSLLSFWNGTPIFALAFSISPTYSATNICASPPVNVVPTLSQWGLILFGLTTLCIGGIALWRRNYRFERPSLE